MEYVPSAWKVTETELVTTAETLRFPVALERAPDEAGDNNSNANTTAGNVMGERGSSLLSRRDSVGLFESVREYSAQQL